MLSNSCTYMSLVSVICPFITTFFLNLLSATESGSRGRSTLAIEDHRVAWFPREDFRIIAKGGAGPVAGK